MGKIKTRNFIISHLLLILSTSSHGQKELSFYTTVEVLREKKYDYYQKKRWIMKNILSLDEGENLKSYSLKKSLLKNNFSNYIKKQKKGRELQLKKWEEVLK